MKKAIAVIAVEANDGKIGRVRLQWVPDVFASSLEGFLSEMVISGTTVHTGGWFTFGFDRGSSAARGLLFYRLLEQAIHCVPGPISELYRGTGRGSRPHRES